MTPTQRSLKHYRDQGMIAEVVEKYNSFIRQRRDLFNFADILSVDPINRVNIFCQTTSGSNFSDRKKKILKNEYAQDVLLAGNKIHIHGWRKAGPKGKRKTWSLRFEEVTLKEFKNAQGILKSKEQDH